MKRLQKPAVTGKNHRDGGGAIVARRGRSKRRCGGGGGGGRRGDWVGGGIGGRGVPRLTVRPSDAERKVDGG